MSVAVECQTRQAWTLLKHVQEASYGERSHKNKSAGQYLILSCGSRCSSGKWDVSLNPLS